VASNEPTAREAQTIEQLRGRYEKLNERRIQVQERLDTARRRLKELQEQAAHDYGTADVGELQAKLEAMKAENLRKRAEYQASLDSIEADLARVENAHAADEAPTANGANAREDDPWQ
jgi:hypothetical protein